MTHKCKVMVVGGGVMGASVAWHLIQAGAVVTLIDQGPGSTPSATSASFGWVGASAGTPSDDPDAFALRLHALEDISPHWSYNRCTCRGYWRRGKRNWLYVWPIQTDRKSTRLNSSHAR